MKKYKTWEALKMITENPKLIFRYTDETLDNGNYIEIKATPSGNNFSHVNKYGSGQHDSNFLKREWTLINDDENIGECQNSFKEGYLKALEDFNVSKLIELAVNQKILIVKEDNPGIIE